MFKLLVLLMCTSVFGYRPYCNQKSVLQFLKIPTYDFSVRLLDRISHETNGHYIFSPISTWLQLLTLTDGAEGVTLKEIRNVTRHRMVCSKILVKKIFNSLDTELRESIKRRSIVVIDKLLDVKKSFVTKVEKLNAAKVLQERFGSNTNSAATVNNIVDYDTKGIITDILDDDDFKMTVLLVADVASMKANWKSPFNSIYTAPEVFYSYELVPIGYVNMMNQIGFFNFNYIPEINAQALELPFSDRASMILLLPNMGTAEDLFFKMKNTRMASILRLLNFYGTRLINVKMPRFNLTTDIDNMPELLHDMGVRRIFSPRFAELKKISDYRVYVSMMASKYGIEVTETGISANISPEANIKEEDAFNITFNRPFAFVLIDKTTNVILFAGIYSKPSLF